MLADLKSLAPKGDGFVLLGADRSFIDPDKFDAEIWSAVTARAETAGTRFHDLRHFFRVATDRARRDGRLRARPDGAFEY